MKKNSKKNHIFGLIGKEIGYSFSKNYFMDKFKRESITQVSYEIFDIQKIEDVLWVFKNPYLKGCNITIPYKKSIIYFLTELTPEAKSIGSVNVVKINEDGHRIGYNTDIIGFELSFKKDINKLPKNPKALIFGTGGVSMSVSFILNKLGIYYKNVSRRKNKDFLGYEEIDRDLLEEYKILINCTPVGTYPRINLSIPLPYQYLSSNHYLYDLVYNPSKTLFLKKGEERGAMIRNGLEMFRIQAEESWKIWNY
ncbi:MAG: shikimate dehydrogenase [Flavobacteriales bacterium]|jgi:shikimate dehydrogenase|uniref:shikimate dehydrogenase family protein n=1 Tax=Blattabacterium sp. (Mastotermes darwiniensis) TaxID=39768 RepID=UPI000231DEC4|nr:shikimate 5-dehydrogenase [Blattabacterium sp. (Mastotermes darwiniensis)]AER40760.1 shikimate 5-dehydrogenase [Blattabacterium sp. (Mastotermes darwiniensis) str. MADAR]MDR1804603.1 shikimate dehydrogenase [Flavobacteriales bacterium]